MNIQNLGMKFHIVLPVATPGAEERFFRMCGFDLGAVGHRKMEQAAYKVRNHLLSQMKIRAFVQGWDHPQVEGADLHLGDTVITCDAFSQIPKEAIKGAFAYLLTIGETDIEAEDYIMTEIYHDIWGTAYIDSAMEVLRRDCLMPMIEEEGFFLSENFGPGYFGMAMEEGSKIFDLLDGAAIGVSRKASGLLIPEKSILGLILVYDREDIKMSRSCEKCLGNKGGCNFCEKRIVKER